jgi:hypothetical protein
MKSMPLICLLMAIFFTSSCFMAGTIFWCLKASDYSSASLAIVMGVFSIWLLILYGARLGSLIRGKRSAKK